MVKIYFQSKKWIMACIAALALGMAGCHSPKQLEDVVIVPQPLSVEKGSGSFSFSGKTVIAVADDEQRIVAENFASLFTKSAGFTPKVEKAKDGNIVFSIDQSMKTDAYELQITSDKITIKAADVKGSFYALQNIRLMLPPAIEGQEHAAETWAVPAVTIKDEPRFDYRGFMLDVSRYFLPKEDVIRMIDCISMLKINRLHLHLTDDNGWRLEIKKYPRLTEVGAWKVDRQNLPFPDRRNPKKGEPATVGGFYTQEDMKEIIRYAAERQVEIIPEIDIPAHSNAALAEIAWVPKEKKNWNEFLKGLDNFDKHLEQKEIIYARSMYNIQHKVTPEESGKLKVELECERPDMEIHYTLDGTEPMETSAVYDSAFVVDKNVEIKAATFTKGKQMGKTLILPIHWNKATAKPLVGAPKEMGILVNGLRGSLKQTDFEWYTGGLSQPISFVVDLLKPEKMKRFAVGCITNYGMAVHKPRMMKVEVSDDNKIFKEIGKLTFTDDEIFKEGNFIEDLSIENVDIIGHYIKFTLETPGNCPDNHVRPGQASKVYLDEVIIE